MSGKGGQVGIEAAREASSVDGGAWRERVVERLVRARERRVEYLSFGWAVRRVRSSAWGMMLLVGFGLGGGG